MNIIDLIHHVSNQKREPGKNVLEYGPPQENKKNGPLCIALLFTRWRAILADVVNMGIKDILRINRMLIYFYWTLFYHSDFQIAGPDESASLHPSQ